MALGPGELKSDWMLATDLALQLERGDLIQVKRKSYTHWVVFIGIFNDIPCVAHISTDVNESATKREFRAKLLKACAAMVRSDPFQNVVGMDLCRINNSLDAQRRPFPPSIIVERAIAKLGTGGYHLVVNNCEHFAKWCRYALRESEQSLVGQAGAIGLLMTAATTSLPFGLAAGAFGFTILKIGQGLKRRCLLRPII